MNVLMVCLGNICRSPMAEGVLRTLAREHGLAINVDSAGTSDYHVGDPPDHRAQQAMRRHGMDISALRGRQFSRMDFDRSDIILVMDQANLRNARAMAPDAEAAGKVRLIMDHAPDHLHREVPDPYYGGEEGFEAVFQMLVVACKGLLQEFARR